MMVFVSRHQIILALATLQRASIVLVTSVLSVDPLTFSINKQQVLIRIAFRTALLVTITPIRCVVSVTCDALNAPTRLTTVPPVIKTTSYTTLNASQNVPLGQIPIPLLKYAKIAPPAAKNVMAIPV